MSGDPNCWDCDGSGWTEDWSTSCGDPSCCSPAMMACETCNPSGTNPTYDNHLARATGDGGKGVGE